MFGLMCVCVYATHTLTQTHAAQLKLKAEAVHQVRFGSRFLVSSHGHNQEPLTPPLCLPLTPSLSLPLPPFCMCACVSVVCDLVPEVSMSVGPSGLTLTVQWSGERDTGRGRGEAVTLRLSHRQSSCCVYKFSVCLSIDRQTRQFDWLFCWYSTSSFSFHWRRSNFALRQYLFTLRFQGILPCLFTFVATTSRKPNLHNLLPLRTSTKTHGRVKWVCLFLWISI